MTKLVAFAILVAAAACHHGAGHHHHHAAATEPPLTEAAIAMPIAPGKTAAWRQAIEELTGPRYAEYAASRARFGLTAQATWLQHTPMGDLAVIYMTGPDVRASFNAMSSSRDTWDVAWRALTADLHGVDFARGERVTPRLELAFRMDDGGAAGAKPFVFVAPLSAAGAVRLRALGTELMHARHADYVRARARIGVRRELVFVETTALGDAAVFYWLADDPRASLARLAASTEPFDAWLRGEAERAHPIALAAIADIATRNELVGQFPHP